jgi:predicted GIY-YIG superfamily endonuclease
MPDYHPDPADGLRGDALVSETLLRHADGRHATTDPGVYVLRCCDVGESVEAHARAWRDAGYEDTHPDDLDRLAAADRLLYVGAASNVRSRLEDHAVGEKRQGAFTTAYPPFTVVGVEWFDSPDRAFERERRIAMQLADDLDDAAVWCDGVVW